MGYSQYGRKFAFATQHWFLNAAERLATSLQLGLPLFTLTGIPTTAGAVLNKVQLRKTHIITILPSMFSVILIKKTL